MQITFPIKQFNFFKHRACIIYKHSLFELRVLQILTIEQSLLIWKTRDIQNKTHYKMLKRCQVYYFVKATLMEKGIQSQRAMKVKQEHFGLYNNKKLPVTVEQF